MSSSEAMRSLAGIAGEIHHLIRTRFMSPDHLIYDYAGPNGEVHLPTPEECSGCKPNAMAWWAPIEDCAFLTADYLTGQCNRYRLQKSEERRGEIRGMVSGLYKLQDVCGVPGMIARGIGSDGKCHPRASSNDQVIPWLIALREFQKTDIPTESERRECRDRMRALLAGLRAANWSIPGEGAGFTRGSFLHIDGLEGRLSSVHLAFVAKLSEELGDSPGWYRRVLTEPLANGKTRLGIIGEGYLDFHPGHGWFLGHAQYAVRELLRAETDPEFRVAFTDWLKVTGKLASDDIRFYREWNPGVDDVFTPDWRCMLTAWTPQSCCKDAERVAGAELEVWHRACPAVRRDKETALRAFPAAWIMLMSGDDAFIAEQLPEIEAMLRHFDYSRFYYAAPVFAENAVQELLDRAD